MAPEQVHVRVHHTPPQAPLINPVQEQFEHNPPLRVWAHFQNLAENRANHVQEARIPGVDEQPPFSWRHKVFPRRRRERSVNVPPRRAHW